MELNPVTHRKAGRIAGFWYVLWAATGMYSMLYVPPKLIVRGDAAATAARMEAGEFLFRTMIVADLVNIVIMVILLHSLYTLFGRVNGRDAKLMVAFLLILAPAVFVMEALNIAAVMLFRGDVLTTLDPVRRQDVAMFLLGIDGYLTSTFVLFWGVWLLPLAALVFRSRFVPRAIGGWLALNGLAYVAMGFARILHPPAADAVYTYAMPLLFGELAFMLWLLVMGANVGWWNERLRASGG